MAAESVELGSGSGGSEGRREDGLVQRERLAGEKARADSAVNASLQGFVRGSLYGLGLGVASSLAAQRVSETYRSLRLPIKAAFVTMAVLGVGTLASEHAIYRFNRPLPKERHNAEWSLPQLLLDHRLALVGSVTGLAVLVSGYVMARNRNISGTQKFMNIRLYGQMAGLATIALAMGLTAARRTVPDDDALGKERRL